MKGIEVVKEIKLSGSSYDIGRSHGEQGKTEIKISLETYEALFHGYTGMSWNEVREKALLHHDAIMAF